MEEMSETVKVITEDDEKYVRFNFDVEGWNKRLSIFKSFPPIQPVSICFANLTFVAVKLELIAAQGCFH
jgi:hypothetical protein